MVRELYLFMIQSSKCPKCNGNNVRVEIIYPREDGVGWTAIDIRRERINLLENNKERRPIKVMTNCNDCMYTSSKKPKVSVQLNKCPDCGNTKAECVDYEYVDDGVFDINFECSRCSHNFSSKGKFDNSKSILQRLFNIN